MLQQTVHAPSFHPLLSEVRLYMHGIVSRSLVHSLTHLDVSEDALILKKVAFTWLAMHFPATTHNTLTMITLLAVRSKLPTNESLSCARGTKEQDTFRRPTKTCEYITVCIYKSKKNIEGHVCVLSQ